MSITIKDIAKIAGVSHTTVLKALKDKPKISPELRDRIKKIADENNYVPNANARNLVLKENKVIGLVITDISIPLFAELTKAVEEVARMSGYNVIVICSDNDRRKEEDAVMSLQELQVAGMIITPSYKGSAFVERLNKSKMPYLILGKLDGADTDHITFDDRAATYKAAKYLTEIGHKRIACISTGEASVNPFRYWIDGYKKALAEADISFDPGYVFSCNADSDAGYRVVRKILSGPELPTALISLSDLTVMGIIRGLKDNGVDIPKDMSVITLMDDDIFKYCTPSLTAVAFPKRELGRLSAEYLFKMIKSGRGGKTKIELPVELIIRESTCKKS